MPDKATLENSLSEADREKFSAMRGAENELTPEQIDFLRERQISMDSAIVVDRRWVERQDIPDEKKGEGLMFSVGDDLYYSPMNELLAARLLQERGPKLAQKAAGREESAAPAPEPGEPDFRGKDLQSRMGQIFWEEAEGTLENRGAPPQTRCGVVYRGISERPARRAERAVFESRGLGDKIHRALCHPQRHPPPESRGEIGRRIHAGSRKPGAGAVLHGRPRAGIGAGSLSAQGETDPPSAGGGGAALLPRHIFAPERPETIPRRRGDFL